MSRAATAPSASADADGYADAGVTPSVRHHHPRIRFVTVVSSVPDALGDRDQREQQDDAGQPDDDAGLAGSAVFVAIMVACGNSPAGVSVAFWAMIALTAVGFVMAVLFCRRR